MKQITIQIPESKFNFFIELLKNFDFVKIEEIDGDAKESVVKNLEQGFSELKKFRQGKLKTTKAKDFLNEL